MTILAVGNEGDSFTTNFGITRYQTSCKDPLARGGIAPTQSQRHTLKLSSAVSEVWLHGYMYQNTTGDSTTLPLIGFLDSVSPGVDALRLLQIANYTTFQNSVRAAYWNGSAYVTIAEFSLPSFSSGGSGFEFDIHFKMGSSGRFRMFVERQLIMDKSGSYTPSISFDTVRFGAPDATGSYYGSIIAADECTVGLRLDSIIPNATGGGAGWTNATVANLADTTNAPAVNTATLASTNAAGSTFLLNYENPATFATIREAKGVSVASCGILQAGSGFTNLFLYVNSVTLGNMSFTPSFTSYQQFLATDPATSTAWTNTSISNMTIGAITT
ncbi:MAG: hypothetical protein ACKO0Z_07340 [Betaproteobacteria bacterium]